MAPSLIGDWVVSAGGPVADARGPVAGSLSSTKLMFFFLHALSITQYIYIYICKYRCGFRCMQDQFCLLKYVTLLRGETCLKIEITPTLSVFDLFHALCQSC